MKRFFAIFALLSLVALVGCDDVKVGLRSDMYVMYYTSTDGNIVVPKADAFDANIISNTYKDGQGKIAFDIDISTIGEAAFFECSTLRSITIPEGVTTIEYGAFYNCANLKEVTLPEGVVTIGNYAFCHCLGLHNIKLPASVAFLGNYAFSGCTYLVGVYCKATTPPVGGHAMFANNGLYRQIYVPAESVEAYRQAQYWIEYSAVIKGYNFEKDNIEAVTTTIQYTTTDGQVLYPNDADALGATIITNYYEDGKGVMTFDGDFTTIGYHAFYGCERLASISIPNSVSSIATAAFAYCPALTSISIPNGVTSIGGSVFSGCSSLTSVTIPDSVTSIGSSTFSGCSSLTSITIPDSVTSIGYSTFSSCTSLTSVTIGDGVTKIGNYAFEDCTSLTSVTIPDSVTSIGYNAFSGCTSLTSITIPNSVTSIGYYAFGGCTSLKSVYCIRLTPPIGGDYMFYSNASWRKIYVPAESVEAYKTAAYWRDYAADIVGYEF